MGVSFSGPNGWYDGLFICTALGIHNIPEGLAVAAVMFARGWSLKHAAFWATIHALPQPALAVVGFVALNYCLRLMPLAMGFGAGASSLSSQATPPPAQAGTSAQSPSCSRTPSSPPR